MTVTKQGAISCVCVCVQLWGRQGGVCVGHDQAGGDQDLASV